MLDFDAVVNVIVALELVKNFVKCFSVVFAVLF